MIIRTACPRCGETNYKKNGKTHHGKQNHQCRRCRRELILQVDREPISQEEKESVQKLLLERISLRGICRVVGVSLDWLLTYLVTLYDELPDHLNVSLECTDNNFIIQRLEVEAEGMHLSRDSL